MNPKREEAVFALAWEKSTAARAAFLDLECMGDPALRQRIDALLSAHEGQSKFLPRDATTEATPTVVEEFKLTEGAV